MTCEKPVSTVVWWAICSIIVLIVAVIALVVMCIMSAVCRIWEDLL